LREKDHTYANTYLWYGQIYGKFDSRVCEVAKKSVENTEVERVFENQQSDVGNDHHEKYCDWACV